MKKRIFICVLFIVAVAAFLVAALEFRILQAVRELHNLSAEEIAQATVLANQPDKETELDEEDIYKTKEEERVSYSHGTVSLSISIPEGWEYEIEEYQEGGANFGINFRPTDQTEGILKFHYHEFFGVCGTGLSEEIITLGEYEARQGTFDNGKVWDFISLRNEEGVYVIMNNGADHWLKEYMEEAMEILNTIHIGDV